MFVTKEEDERRKYLFRIKLLEACVLSGINLIENMRVPQTRDEAAVDVFLKFGPWLRAAKQVVEEKV